MRTFRIRVPAVEATKAQPEIAEQFVGEGAVFGTGRSVVCWFHAPGMTSQFDSQHDLSMALHNAGAQLVFEDEILEHYKDVAAAADDVVEISDFVNDDDRRIVERLVEALSHVGYQSRENRD